MIVIINCLSGFLNNIIFLIIDNLGRNELIVIQVMMIVGMMRLWLLHLMMVTERDGLMMVMMKRVMGLMVRDRVHLVM